MKTKKQQKIGIFGGTFDPIHFGHLNMAMDIMESRGLDEVWFCPARRSPHKPDITPAEAEHRVKMLKIALAHKPGFRVLDIETKREGPSYTIDTLKELINAGQKQNAPQEFALMLGSDSLEGFFKWRKPDEIVKLVPLLIGIRTVNFNIDELQGDAKILEAMRKGITPTRLMEISATQIRERLKKGLYCGHLVPLEVLDYIYTNHLYSIVQ